MTEDLQKEYSDFMTEKTGRDEYECELSVYDQTYLDDSKDK